MRLYSELSGYFHLVTPPEDYKLEAQHIVRLAEAVCDGPAGVLLELGSGGGNMASHLKHRFTCTLTEISPQMLGISGKLNPECRHLQGDMRTLRLGDTFDVVLIHDAIGYMTTEDDLAAAVATASAHVRPGGAAIFVPDAIAETFAPATEHGGCDGPEGESLRYLQWSHDGATGATAYPVDFVFMIRAEDASIRIEHDRHTIGLFPRATWLRLIDDSGLNLINLDLDDPYAGERVVFAARKRS